MKNMIVVTFVAWFTVAAAIPQGLIQFPRGPVEIIGTPSGTPPTITSVTAAPNVLWPPNHKMVPVSLQVSATGDPSPECRINSVRSNEASVTPGEDEWVAAGTLTVNLRAERADSGNGRVYSIDLTCTNTSGSASQTITVNVPHNR